MPEFWQRQSFVLDAPFRRYSISWNPPEIRTDHCLDLNTWHCALRRAKCEQVLMCVTLHECIQMFFDPMSPIWYLLASLFHPARRTRRVSASCPNDWLRKGCYTMYLPMDLNQYLLERNAGILLKMWTDHPQLSFGVVP